MVPHPEMNCGCAAAVVMVAVVVVNILLLGYAVIIVIVVLLFSVFALRSPLVQVLFSLPRQTPALYVVLVLCKWYDW